MMESSYKYFEECQEFDFLVVLNELMRQLMRQKSAEEVVNKPTKCT